MTALRGRIYDRASGRPLEARVCAIASTGAFCATEDALHKVGPGELINLQQVVEPISRGVLVDDASPDYPPLVDACDATRGQVR